MFLEPLECWILESARDGKVGFECFGGDEHAARTAAHALRDSGITCRLWNLMRQGGQHDD